MWFKMHPWVFPATLGGIGIFYLVLNIGADLTSRKLQKEGQDRHVSGIHLLIAGLISTYKWLALLCVLDFTFWEFLMLFLFTEEMINLKTTKISNLFIRSPDAVINRPLPR